MHIVYKMYKKRFIISIAAVLMIAAIIVAVVLLKQDGTADVIEMAEHKVYNLPVE